MAEVQKQGKPTDQKYDEWEDDLHRHSMMGSTREADITHPEKAEPPTAHDIKALHQMLKEFSDNDLKQIIVLPKGTRLEQGATYIDLNDSERKEFTAMGGMEADDDHYYVPKTETSYPIWNRLIGVQNPDRLDEASQ